VIPVFVHLVGKRLETPSVKTERGGRDRMYFVVAALATLVAALLFYLLRARTHFQGDGYHLLGLLASQVPTFRKFTETGTAIVLQWLWNLVGGDVQAAALLSYQVISVAAGVLLVVVVAAFARKMYDRTVERVLFLFGACTGGYMLLFFGYVENYSLFVLSVLTYTLTGLLAAKGRTSRYWILAPLLAAAFFHVLGVTLVPSALYLWIGPTRLGRTIRNWKWSTRLIGLAPIVAVAGYVFYHVYTTNYFFRFAFVPLFENRFTVDGYTMFSMKHLTDFLNLLFLLVPGLLIVIVSLFDHSVRHALRQRPFMYLVVLTSSVLAAVFIFDPKLGMSRDWDLFSFAGVPLAVLIISLHLTTDVPTRSRLLAVGCAVGLAVLLLIPRALTLANTERGLALVEYQVRLDQQKSKSAVALLVNFYSETGNNEAAQRVSLYAEETFPEDGMHDEAMSMLARGEYRRAEPILQEIITKAPMDWTFWTSLGACYFYLDKTDSAMDALDIALGINPRGPRALNNRAAVYLKVGDYDAAEALWVESHEIDSEAIEPLVGLVELYKKTRQEQKYYQDLLELNTHADAPTNYRKELGDYLLAKRQYKAAAEAYKAALDHGVDSAYVQGLLSQYPELWRVWR